MSRIPVEWIDRYFAGEIAPDEVRALKRWMEERSEHLEQIDTFQRGDYSRHSLAAQSLEDASWRRVRKRTMLSGAESNVLAQVSASTLVAPDGHRISTHAISHAIVRTPVAHWSRIRIPAIVIALLLIVGVSLYQLRSSRAPAWQTYSAQSGQRIRIDLPDGSTALLNAKSQLRFSSGFGKSTRDVYLQGEAIFTVARSGGQPFIVHAANTVTRVLGTVFSVRRYPSDPGTSVVVAEGRVSVHDSVLSVADAALIDANGIMTIRHGADIAKEFAWTSGRLVFYLTPLSDAIAELERWYGITIRVDDPRILDRQISTTLHNENARQALDLLAAAIRVRAIWSGNTITLSSQENDS